MVVLADPDACARFDGVDARGFLFVSVWLTAVDLLHPAMVVNLTDCEAFCGVWVQHSDQNLSKSWGVHTVERWCIWIVAIRDRLGALRMLRVPLLPAVDEAIEVNLAARGLIPKRRGESQANHDDSSAPDVETSRVIFALLL